MHYPNGTHRHRKYLHTLQYNSMCGLSQCEQHQYVSCFKSSMRHSSTKSSTTVTGALEYMYMYDRLSSRNCIEEEIRSSVCIGVGRDWALFLVQQTSVLQQE